MKNKISINRIVPNIKSDYIEESKRFYTDFLDMEMIMDMGWIITFASKENKRAQISVIKNDQKQRTDNAGIFLSIEVADVNKLYEKAKKFDLEIIYELTNEEWGVKRFFVKDPNGATINLLQHLT